MSFDSKFVKQKEAREKNSVGINKFCLEFAVVLPEDFIFASDQFLLNDFLLLSPEIIIFPLCFLFFPG